jgi:hypothetical protein
MKCPHCHKSFHQDIKTDHLGYVGTAGPWKYYWLAHKQECPACHKPIVFIEYQKDFGRGPSKGETFMVFPKGANRPPAPPEVPEAVAQDFGEACLVFDDSPQASAALSRRCLQLLLADRGVSQSDNLSTAIDAALACHLPSHIAENLDAIRNIGNFAAHPQKSKNSGAIMPVEPHEAEWNLDVLEMLFDYFYVQPAVSAARRDALNKKLEEAGKKPMKVATNEVGDTSA